MATASTKTETAVPSFEAVPNFEAATERARENGDRLLEAGRKMSGAYLDGFEKYLIDVAQFERKIAKQSQVDAVASILDAHADLTEKFTKVSVSAARELITA
jgi:hypothetical protein